MLWMNKPVMQIATIQIPMNVLKIRASGYIPSTVNRYSTPFKAEAAAYMLPAPQM